MLIHPHAAHAWSFWFVLTSLLLLLRSDQLQLLGLVKKLGPLLVRRKLLVGREQGLGRRDPNSNLELRVRFSLHSTHCRRNVGRIATDGGANVPLTNEFPRSQLTTHLGRAPALYCGPFRSRASAEKFESQFLDLFQIRR